MFDLSINTMTNSGFFAYCEEIINRRSRYVTSEDSAKQYREFLVVAAGIALERVRLAQLQRCPIEDGRVLSVVVDRIEGEPCISFEYDYPISDQVQASLATLQNKDAVVNALGATGEITGVDLSKYGHDEGVTANLTYKDGLCVGCEIIT